MDKANLSSVRKRIEQAKQPYEVYDSLGRLKQEVFPYTPTGRLVIEIIYSRDELYKNEAV